MILRDPRRDAHYRLSPMGWFLWQRLDGMHTLQDLTSEYTAVHGVSPPHVVVETVTGLVEAGFVKGVQPGARAPWITDEPTVWQRAVATIRRVLDGAS